MLASLKRTPKVRSFINLSPKFFRRNRPFLKVVPAICYFIFLPMYFFGSFYKISYQTIDECFLDRHSEGMRQRWYEEICKYNSEDKIRLVKEIFKNSDCYVGLRSFDELRAAQEFYGSNLLCIWIDAEGRIPDEPTSSCTVIKEQADIIIENKGSLERFHKKLRKLCYLIDKPQNIL